MTNLQEVPTEELLSFQDYAAVHNPNNKTVSLTEAQINIGDEKSFEHSSQKMQTNVNEINTSETTEVQSFWSIKYYQTFFDVDTTDVTDRIIASITPKWDNKLKHHLRTKPDLYGPFWISVTLIFTIAISGNIADYLQHANEKHHWKYDFHLVSYAATTIFLYVTVIPSILWGLLKWSVQVNDIEGLEADASPGALELICIYGYSLFIYIPVSVLWSIQINFLQWTLVLAATFVSGSVLLLTIMPALRLSRHKMFLCFSILFCHLLLAAGFMLYFFHVPNLSVVIDHHKVNNETAIH